MVTMIEPDPDADAVLVRQRDQFVNLPHGNARRFFHDDVFARADGRGGNFGQRGIDGGHNHGVHLRIGDGWLEIGDGAAGFGEFHQFLGARQVGVAGHGEF